MQTPTCRDWRVGPRHPGRPCHRLHEESHASLWRWPRAPSTRPHLASPSAAAIRAVVCSRLHVVCRLLSVVWCNVVCVRACFTLGPAAISSPCCSAQRALLYALCCMVCVACFGLCVACCMLHVARCVLLFLAGPPRDLVRAAAVLHEPRAALPRRRNPGTDSVARRTCSTSHGTEQPQTTLVQPTASAVQRATC